MTGRERQKKQTCAGPRRSPVCLPLAALAVLGGIAMVAGEPLVGSPELSLIGSYVVLLAGGLYLFLRLRSRRVGQDGEEPGGGPGEDR